MQISLLSSMNLVPPGHLGGAEGRSLTLGSRLWAGAAPLVAWPMSHRARREKAVAMAAGATAVVTTAAAVGAEGRSVPWEPHLEDSAQLEFLAATAQQVRSAGAELLLELRHGGPRAGDLSPVRPLGPSSIPDPLNKRSTQAMDRHWRQAVEKSYLAAAELGVAAGVGILGLEIANGSLLHAMVSPLYWPKQGPELEQGWDYVCQLVQHMSRMAPLVVRLCGNDLASGGLTCQQGVSLAQRLARAGAWALVITAGSRFSLILQRSVRPPGPLAEASHGRLASWVRRSVDIPVGCVGGLRSRAAMDAMLTAGWIDFAVLERPFACQPDLGVLARAGDFVASCSSRIDCLS